MDFMILSAIIFFMSLLIIELSLYAYRHLTSTRKSKIKKRLRKYVLVEDDFGDILKKRNFTGTFGAKGLTNTHICGIFCCS